MDLDTQLGAGKYDLGAYAFVPATLELMPAYEDLVREVYTPLGFMNDHAKAFMPRAGSRCYLLMWRGEEVGSCCLTPVLDPHSVFHTVIPVKADPPAPMIELNNVILVPELRGGVGLALILYHAACIAMAEGVNVVVGITRYQTLRYFVEAGATPALHEPLHLLGRDDLDDFVIYYDTTSVDAQTYLRERAKRLVHQNAVMHKIREKVGGRHSAAPADGAVAAA